MATPAPDHEIARLHKLLKGGLPRVLLVSGGSDFFRAEAMDMVMEHVPSDAELRVLDAVDLRDGGGDDEDEDDGDVVVEASDGDDGLAACPELLDLRGGGLFAKTSVLVVRRGKNWWKRNAVTLAGQLDRFAKGSSLVIEADKLDKRKKVAANLVKSVAETGGFFEFRDLYPTGYGTRDLADGELVRWILARSRRLGVALTGEAACLLVAQVGTTLGELAAELGRLRDQLGADAKRAPLGPRDLQGKLTVSFESTPFELAEAVLDGDKRLALRSVQAMFARGVRDKAGKAMDTGGLLPFTTSWMFRSIAAVYEGRLLLAEGVSERDIPARVGVRQFVPRFVGQLRQNDLPRLERGLLALQACQRASRSSGEEPQVLLERFLCQWFDGAPIPRAEDFES